MIRCLVPGFVGTIFANFVRLVRRLKRKNMWTDRNAFFFSFFFPEMHKNG